MNNSGRPKGYWKDTDNFIKESIKVHGDKFLYNEVDVSESPNIVNLTCRKHGNFDCHLYNHLKGKGGCKQCQYENLSELFTNKENIGKGDYILEGQIYQRCIEDKHEIMCEKHEVVYTISDIRRIRGCHKCKQEERDINTLENFYNNILYTLEEEYYNVTINHDQNCVEFYCKKHEVSEKIAKNLFNSFKKRTKKCKLCAKELIRKRLSFTDEDFIKKSKARYGERFTYDKVNYVNQNTPLILSCKKHGEFSTYPNNHLKGITGGCKECENNLNSISCWKGKRKALQGDFEKKDTYFYVIRIYPLGSKADEDGFYKIGLARCGVKKRYSGKKYSNKFNYEIYLEEKITEFKGVMLECFLLEIFKQYKTVPEEKFEGYTECFYTLTYYMIYIIEEYTGGKLQR